MLQESPHFNVDRFVVPDFVFSNGSRGDRSQVSVDHQHPDARRFARIVVQASQLIAMILPADRIGTNPEDVLAIFADPAKLVLYVGPGELVSHQGPLETTWIIVPAAVDLVADGHDLFQGRPGTGANGLVEDAFGRFQVLRQQEVGR